MKANRLLVLAAATVALVGCSSVSTPKYLVLYYSQNGTTKAVAEEVAGQLGVEAVSFDVVNPYDGTYEETISRCLAEREEGTVPELATLSVNPNDYDVIFLGYPIWFGTYAPPVAALLAEYDFAGKTVVPFSTFGSGGLESGIADLCKACPEATVADGYGVRAARVENAPAEVETWLKSLGYLEGEVEELPEYGEEYPVGEEEAAIFQAACGSYPMPLGAPSAVCSRETSHGTDYVFITAGTTPNGEEFTSRIYVTCAPDSDPDFVKVVR